MRKEVVGSGAITTYEWNAQHQLLAVLQREGRITKLALAEEFNAIGDTDGARTLIEEVVAESSGALKARAQRMLAELG